MKDQKIIVLGAGIVGLSCAYALKRRGFEVQVLEAGACGGQASGAAAGMLAPYTENPERDDPFFQFGRRSLLLYQDWIEEVERISGVDAEWVGSGSLTLASHEADVTGLMSRAIWQQAYDPGIELWRAEELVQRVPGLGQEWTAALYTPSESHVYAPAWVKSLEVACRKSGVAIEEHLGHLELKQTNPIQLSTSEGLIYEADQLVVCSGAWTGGMEHGLTARIPVFPIRGQICAYAVDGLRSGGADLPYMLFGSQGYLVRKGNGTIVAGASEDIAGFETSVTDRGIKRLVRWAGRLIPELQEREPVHSWAGLRPATPDGYPILGRDRKHTGIVWAAGHYRNGILLSPATAEAVAAEAAGDANAALLMGGGAFAIDRFQRERYAGAGAAGSAAGGAVAGVHGVAR